MIAFVELHGLEQSFTSSFFDQVALHGPQLFSEDLSELSASFGQVFFDDDLASSLGDGHTHWISSVRASVITWLDDVHHVLLAEDATDRNNSTRNGFAHGYDIRLIVPHVVVVAHHLPGPSEAGLDLVDDQKTVVFPAEFFHFLQIALFWNKDASFSLDWLQHHRHDVWV